jgi:hypothetical protein
MPEQEVRRLLNRLNADAGFRERFQRDIPGGLAQFAFSPTQRLALAAVDDDALRRLTGTDAGIRVDAVERSWLSRLLCTRWFCGPPRTRDWQCPKQP